MAVDTLTVQPCGKGTYLSQPAPTTNNSGGDFLAARDSTAPFRPITEFSKAGLPANAVIISAALSLYYYLATGTDPVGRTIKTHKLKRTDWVENQATWNIYKTGSNWTSAGGDYEASSPAPASAVMPASYGWVAFDVLAIVQAAFTAGANFEFLTKFDLETGTTDYRAYFYSGYYAGDTSKRPKLVITYVRPPDAPTGLIASDGLLTDKVTLTWTAASAHTNAVGGYKVYRDGADISGWLGTVLTYDDTGADPPVITPGTAAATGNRYSKSVRVDIRGGSIADGTVHSYVVRAKDTADYEGADSAANTGYRGKGPATFQWQRSGGDSDAAYADIAGGVYRRFYDYGAPANPAGRYYKCKVTAPGAVDAYTAAVRGYRRDPAQPAIPSQVQLIIKNTAGDVLAHVMKISGISTDEVINQLRQMEFIVPSDEAALAVIDDTVEIWLVCDGDLIDIFRRAVKDSES